MRKNREIEIKLRIEDVPALVAKLEALGAKRIRRVFEMDTLFESFDGEFRKRRAILRLRQEMPMESVGNRRRLARRTSGLGGILTFKGPIESRGAGRAKYKEREEIEFRVEDVGRFERVLRRIGMRPWFRYEKYRTRYRAAGFGGLHIDLDETPIGVFLELEGSRVEIDRAAIALGYSEEDYITGSYLELYAAECMLRRVPRRDMTFRANRAKKFC